MSAGVRECGSAEWLLREFDAVADAPDGVQRLRELILQLAVRGKLVPQDPGDEPASVLLERIEAEKRRLYAEGKISKPKKLPPVNADEAPFGVSEGWEWTHVGTICDVIGGIQKSPKRRPVTSHFPYLRVANVQRGFLDLTNIERFELSERELERWRLEAGDLLIVEGNGSENEIGRCAQWHGRIADCVHQNHLIRARPITRDLGGFILKVLNSPVGIAEMKRLAVTTSGLFNLSIGKIKGVTIPLPPLAEQRRIVEKVDQLMALCDELEERQRRRVRKRDRLNRSALHHLTTAADDDELTRHWGRIQENFELLYDAPEAVTELRQTVLQLAVRGKLVPQDPGDEPASALLERIEEEKRRLYAEGRIGRPKRVAPINAGEVPFGVPEGWEWVRFGNVSLDIEAGWSPNCEPWPRSGSEWGVLKISSVSWGRFNPRENKALPRNLEPRPQYEVQAGDFLMSRANTAELVGRSVVIENTPPHLLLNDKTLRVRIAAGMDRHFLNIYNNSSTARTYYSLTASGTSSSMRNLSREHIRALLVPLPPLPEQRRIVERVSQLMALCDELEAKLARARTKSERLAAAVVHYLTAA